MNPEIISPLQDSREETDPKSRLYDTRRCPMDAILKLTAKVLRLRIVY